MRTLERPAAVTSYSHPPANEHARLFVLLDTERALVKELALSTIANTFSVDPVFVNARSGVISSPNGTPRVKVAVVLVALFTVTESAAISANSADGV